MPSFSNGKKEIKEVRDSNSFITHEYIKRPPIPARLKNVEKYMNNSKDVDEEKHEEKHEEVSFKGFLRKFLTKLLN